eukprot:SAG22_NODE_1147_length_5370_cov_3.083855_3_plen_127_part_00
MSGRVYSSSGSASTSSSSSGSGNRACLPAACRASAQRERQAEVDRWSERKRASERGRARESAHKTSSQVAKQPSDHAEGKGAEGAKGPLHVVQLCTHGGLLDQLGEALEVPPGDGWQVFISIQQLY